MSCARNAVLLLSVVVLCACPPGGGTGDGGTGGGGEAGAGGSAGTGGGGGTAGSGGTGGTAGSGGTAGAGGTTDAGNPIVEGCAAYRHALCDFYVRCPIVTRNFQGYAYSSLEQCYATVEPNCEAEFSRPGMQVTKAHLQGCATRLSTQVCRSTADLYCTLTNVRGTKAAGANCASSLECASGSCARATSTTCGTCVDEVMPGQACTRGSDCNNAAGDLTCVGNMCTRIVFGTQGATCDNDALSCAPGFVCSGGHCEAEAGLPADGGACPSGVICHADYECVNGTCQPHDLYVPTDDCSSVTAPVNKVCVAGQVCRQPPAGGPGACAAPTYADAGADCDPIRGVICTPPYDCRGVNQLCQLGLPTLICQ